MGRDTEALIQDLMATPVGRRWLLKAGLGSAAAIAAASLPLGPTSACRSTRRPRPARPRRTGQQRGRRQPARAHHQPHPALCPDASDVRRDHQSQAAGRRRQHAAGPTHREHAHRAPGPGRPVRGRQPERAEPLRGGRAAAVGPGHAGLGPRHARQRPGACRADDARASRDHAGHGPGSGQQRHRTAQHDQLRRPADVAGPDSGADQRAAARRAAGLGRSTRTPRPSRW